MEGLDCVVHPNYDKPIPLLLLGQRYSLDCIEQRIEKEEVRYVPLKIVYKQKMQIVFMDNIKVECLKVL